MKKEKRNVDLKVARVKKDLSQNELANKVGLSRQGYGNIESRGGVTSAVTALKLAQVLETKVEDIFKIK